VTSTGRAILAICGWGCGLLAAIQLPGAILDSVIRGHIAGPLITAAVLVAVAVALLWRRTEHGWPHAGRAIAAVAFAFGLAAVMAQAQLLAMSHDLMEIADVGILVPAPGRSNECRGQPERCHDQVLNELGLRGTLPIRATPQARLVAFVGDSYIFGSGVGEDDTVPADVARMLSDLQPPVAVINAGIPGLNGGSFPGVIRYVRSRLAPDVIVVLLKDDDLDDTDKFTRWAAFRHSFWFRLLSVTNLEPMFETARQLWRYAFSRADDGVALRRYLDAITTASAGTRLVILSALTSDLRPPFDEWEAAHRDVTARSAWDEPRYWDAEKIPHDGHWTESGCRTIAAIIEPLVRAQLTPHAVNRGPAALSN
jgi:hypothetical protein